MGGLGRGAGGRAPPSGPSGGRRAAANTPEAPPQAVRKEGATAAVPEPAGVPGEGTAGSRGPQGTRPHEAAPDPLNQNGTKRYAKGPPARPSWQQSEIDAGQGLGNGYGRQKSYKNGKEVPYGTPGSSRPEFSKKGRSVEVKNYDVTTSQGRQNLINNVANQAKGRVNNLPKGTRQKIQIDVRGQNVTDELLKQLADDIVSKSGGILKRGDITFVK